MGNAVTTLDFWDALVAQPEGDVIGYVFPRKQCELLEHNGSFRRGPLHHDIVDGDAAHRGAIKARDHAQARCLATPRWSDNGHELPVRDCKIDAIKCDDAATSASVNAAHCTEAYVAHCTSPINQALANVEHCVRMI